MNDEEYQRRIDADPAVRHLSERTVREHQKEGMLPEERNPRGAGRKRDPVTAASPSVPVRVPGDIAEDIRTLITQYRKDPSFVGSQIRELAEEMDYYMKNNV